MAEQNPPSGGFVKVNAPDGTVIRFPDTMNQGDILAAMRKRYPPTAPPADAVAAEAKQPPAAQGLAAANAAPIVDDMGDGVATGQPSSAPAMGDKLAASIYGEAIAQPDAVQLPAPAKVRQRAEQGMDFYRREGGDQGMKQRSENLTAMNIADAKASWLDAPRVEQAKKAIETEKLAIKKMEERLSQQLTSLSESESMLMDMANSYKEAIAGRPDLINQLAAEYQQALDAHNRKVSELNEFNKLYSSYQRRVGVDEAAILRRESQINEDVGNPVDLVWNKLVSGSAAVPAAIGDMSLGATLDMAEMAGLIDTDTRKLYEEEMSPMAGAESMSMSISDPVSRMLGADRVTKEYEAKAMENPFIGTALGLVEQAPALALTFSGNIPAATMVYLAQGYSNGMKETSGEEWNNVPMSERRAMATLNAGIESALESFGASEMVGKTQFTRELTKDILAKMKPGMTPGQINRLIDGETDSFFANYAARMLPRAMAESATEAETSMFQGTTKDIYEWAKSGELGPGAQNLFDNPETADQMLDEMKKSALMGAIGAGYIGSIPAISESVSGKRDFARRTPRQFAMMERIVSDPEFINTWKVEAAVAVKQGKVKQSEVDKILDDIAVAKKLVDKLPEDLPAAKREQAFSLLLRKDKLSKKERSLVADEIANIDQQLAALAQTQQAAPESTQESVVETQPAAEQPEAVEVEQTPSLGIGIRDAAKVEQLINEVAPERREAAKAVVEGAARTLGVLEQLGDVDVVLHKDSSTMPDGLKDAKGGLMTKSMDAEGNYKYEMHLNVSIADMWTGAHEATHLGLRRAFGDNPKLYKHFQDRLKKILHEGDFKDIAAIAEAGKYTEGQKPEEFLANLVQSMTRKLELGEPLTPKQRTALQKIIDLFNDALRAIGIKPANLEFKTDQELFDYFNGLAKAIQQDKQLSDEWVAKRGKSPVVQNVGDVAKSYAGVGGDLSQDERESLERAKKQLEAGVSPDTIRKTTGWFMAEHDGKWRTEVPDRGASLLPEFDKIPRYKAGSNAKVSRLGDILKHDALFAKYPELRGVKVVIKESVDDVAKSSQGSYDPEKNLMTITPYALDPLSTVLHEAQHWIQFREKFSVGGNVYTAIMSMPDKEAELLRSKTSDRLKNDIKNRKDLIDHATELLPIANEYEAAREKKKAASAAGDLEAMDVAVSEMRDIGNRVLTDLGDTKARDLMERLDLPNTGDLDWIDGGDILSAIRRQSDGGLIDEARKNLSRDEELLAGLAHNDRLGLFGALALTKEGHDLYQRLYGEKEARDVQARKDFTDKQIRDIEPYEMVGGMDDGFDATSSDAPSSIMQSDERQRPVDPKAEKTYEKMYNDLLDYIEQYDTGSRLTTDAVIGEWQLKNTRDIELAKKVIDNLRTQLKQSKKDVLDAAAEAFSKGAKQGAAAAEAVGRANLVTAIADDRAQRRAIADAVNNKIKSMGRGKLTTNQSKLITKAALSVKPGDQKSLDKFNAFIDSVMDDMVLANKLAGIEKLQGKASRRKQGAAEGVHVPRFTSIKPSDIPDNLVNDYIQALTELSQRVPKYGTMMALKDRINTAKELAEESRKHPFDAVKTVAELQKLAASTNIDVINTVDEYRQAVVDSAAYQRALIRLMDDGAITPAQFDQLSAQRAKSLDDFQSKYQNEMQGLKDTIIKDIKGLDARLAGINFITKERNKLIEDATSLTDQDMSSLTPIELDDLYNALENAALDGTVDVSKISDVVLSAKLNRYKSEMEQANERAEKTGDGVSRKKSIETKAPSYWVNQLGFSSKGGNVVDSQAIDPINTAVSEADILKKDTLKAMRDLMKKHGIKAGLGTNLKNLVTSIADVRGTDVVFDRLGMIVKYMEEYEQGLAEEFTGDVGKRDYFGELISNVGHRQSVEEVGRGATLKNWEAAWSKLPKGKDGRVDMQKLYESVQNNDGRFFPKNEVAFLKDAQAWNNQHLMPKQEFINNWRDQSFSPLGWYMPRVALTKKADAGIIGEADLVNSVVQGKLTTRSSSSYKRGDNSIKPVETNFIKLMEIHANQVGRDYFVSQAIEHSRQALAKMRKLADASGQEQAKWKVEQLSMMLKDKTMQAIEIKKQDNFDKLTNVALSGLTKRLMANPVRVFPEIAAFIPEGAARGQGVASIAKGVRLTKLIGGIEEVDRIMELTGSSVREAGGSSKYLDQSAGQVREEGIVSRAVHFISDPVGSLMTKQAWLGVFAREFQNATKTPANPRGDKLDVDKLKSSKIYRSTYAKEIDAARSAADSVNNRIRTAANAFDKPLKRKTPIHWEGVDSDSNEAKVFGYLTGYTSRQFDAFLSDWRAAMDNAATGSGSAKDFGSAMLKSGLLVGSGMVYSGLRLYLNAAAAYYVASAMAALADDDEDKERYQASAEEQLKQLELVQDTDNWFEKSAESLAVLAASSAANIATSGNPAMYRLIIRGLATTAYAVAESDRIDTTGMVGGEEIAAKANNRWVDARQKKIKELTRKYTFADPFGADKAGGSTGFATDLVASSLPITTAAKFMYDDVANLSKTLANSPDMDEADRKQMITIRAAQAASVFNILMFMRGVAIPSVATNKEMQQMRDKGKEKLSPIPTAKKVMREMDKEVVEQAAEDMSIIELMMGAEPTDNQ